MFITWCAGFDCQTVPIVSQKHGFHILLAWIWRQYVTPEHRYSRPQLRNE